MNYPANFQQGNCSCSDDPKRLEILNIFSNFGLYEKNVDFPLQAFRQFVRKKFSNRH